MSLETSLEPRRRTTSRPGRAAAAAFSVFAHLGLLLVMFPPRHEPPMLPEPEAISVSLIGPPVPEPPAAPVPASPAPQKPKEAKPPPRRVTAKPVPPKVQTVPAEEPDPSNGIAELSEAEIAGAATAGSGAGSGGGGGGRPCDMARWLQDKLRGDARVHAAVAAAGTGSGKALLVWNGDWLQSSGEEGHGLAILREALIWEIAFAPAACRAEPVRGLVLLSLNDSGGSGRFALGTGQWRWSDLTHARGIARR